MDDDYQPEEIVARFGEAIAKLHERRVAIAERRLMSIRSPQSEHDHAMAAYFNAMNEDKMIIALTQFSIEGVLHDLFFMFDQHPEFKLILQSETGEMIDLAQTEEVIQAFPQIWIEERSSAGLETDKVIAFLREKLNLNETRQERRARILAEKNKDKPAT